MRLGGVAADDEDGPRVVNVVVAVGHGAVAPCVRNPRNSGRVTDTGLVIDVVRAPVGRKLAEQISLFVVVLRRAQPVDAIRATFVPDVHHTVANLVDRLLPRDPDPFAVFFFHGILEATLAVGVFANRCTFGAMRAEVERAVPAGFLTRPDTIFHFSNDCTADRAVRTNGFLQFDRANGGVLCIGLSHRSTCSSNRRQASDGKPRPTQECATVDRRVCHVRQDRSPLGASRNPVGLFPKHFVLLTPWDIVPHGLGSLLLTFSSRASRNQSLKSRS